MSTRYVRTLSALATLFAVAACDSAPIDPPTEPPTGASTVAVERGADFPAGRSGAFGAFATPFAGLTGWFADGPNASDEFRGSLSGGALWLTGVQDGRERYSGGAGPLRYNTAPCEASLPYQPFRLASGVTYNTGEWPVGAGAPVTADGTPRVYGDLMEWDSYCTGDRAQSGHFGTFAEVAPSEDVLQNLRVNQAVFQYERADLAGVVFVRYEVTNQGDAPVTDFRAGFFADPDLSTRVGQHYRRNLMGSTDDYAYVYTSTAVPAEVRGAAMAVALLETPEGAPVTTRRISYRDLGPAPDQAAFADAALWQHARPTVFHAVRGLDDDGAMVVHPVTGATVTAMYDGDPVAGAGWLDGTLPGGEDGWDVRVIQSAAPVTLAPGETVVVTVAAIATIQESRAAALSGLADRYRAVAADPSLWRFPIASD